MKIELKHDIKDNFLGVRDIEGLNEVVRCNRFPELVMLAEAYADRRVVEVANEIVKSKRRIILVAGPSSSGKTTFSKKLCVHLAVSGLKPLYLGTDDYFVEREDNPKDENGEYNFEDLTAVDVKLFNSNLRDLLEGKEVDLPTFDFINGTKLYGKRLTKITSDQPIVIEGIHALNDLLTPDFNRDEKFKIYICPIPSIKTDNEFGISNEDHRILRRITRDNRTRGHGAAMTISLWDKVRAGEERNIKPFAEDCDLLFNSSLIYEIAILKKHVYPLLKEIGPDSKSYEVSVRLLDFLSKFEDYTDDEIVPNDSILKEFIGGSLYVD